MYEPRVLLIVNDCVHRIVHSASLVTVPGARVVRSPARLSLDTSAGSRRTVAWSSAAHAAWEADSCHGDSVPQQPCRDTAEAASERTASWRLRAQDVPWNAAVEAAVLQFSTEQGALLPEAEVQPEQQTEQRRMRNNIVQWAAKHPRHRHLEVLMDYMARMRDAAAASEWADDPWRVALSNAQMIARNNSPATVLCNIQAVKQALAEHGIRLSRGRSLKLVTHGGDTIASKVSSLLLALESLPISFDFTKVVSKAPTLLGLDDVEAVLQRRVAAMQQLHPLLDVARVFNTQPSLLASSEQTVASQWVSLQTASGLSDDDMRALVELCPTVLAYFSGIAGWKFQQLRAYNLARTGGEDLTHFSSMSGVLTCASHMVWRLRYLVVAASFQYAAVTWVQMKEDRFAALNPGYSIWLASHPVPPEAYRDWYSSVGCRLHCSSVC